MSQQPPQQQDPPGRTGDLDPQPDHGEDSYVGSGRLQDRAAIITGADSGIGRAVAIAFAREGADVVVAYLDEHEDAEETARWVREAGREAVLVPGDLRDPALCREVVQRCVSAFGKVDVLVPNAAFQMTRQQIEDIPDEEWDRTWRTNVDPIFHMTKAAVAHMAPGSSIVASSSVNADSPSPGLLPYAATKAAIANLMGGLAQMLAERGIRANAVAPGPVWTPLIPSTMPEDAVETFGEQVPADRPGQPAEMAGAYVFLASDEASYVSGAVIAATGGKPML